MLTLAHAAQHGLSRTQFENLCHEIRAPLSCVLGMSRLALNQCDVPATRAHLEGIFHTIDNLVGLLGDALTAAAQDLSPDAKSPQVFAPQDLVEDVRSLFCAGAQLKGLRFVCEADLAHYPAVVGDAARIKQVLLNLLVNALKFTPRGSVELSLQLRRQGRSDARLLCRVRDTGVGMAPDDIAHILQRYCRAQAFDAGLGDIAGHGLGLSICQDLLHSMGSRLQVQSHPGLGTEFSFALTLPGAPEPVQQPRSLDSVSLAYGALGSELGQWSAHLQGLRVLIAEDSPCDQHIMQVFLKLAGVHTRIAANGSEVLQALQSAHFDVLLLDTHMPGMHGLELARRLRSDAQHAGLCIIALSAGSVARQRKAYLALGVAEVLTKPADPLALVRALALCRRAQQPHPADLRDVLDLTDLRRKLGEQEDVVHAVLQVFRRQSLEHWRRLKRHMQRGQVKEASVLAHTLQGASANVGAVAMHASATALLASLRAGPPGLAVQAQFQQALRHTLAALAALAHSAPNVHASAMPWLGHDTVQDDLLLLEQSLGAHDHVSAQRLGQLRRKLKPQQLPLFDLLCQRTRALQYPQAQALMQQLRA